MSLSGKSVVITGAGAGLGAAYARHAASLGAAVTVNDLDAARAEAVVEEISDAGGRAAAHAADISNWDAAHELISFAVETFGRIDGLVNNAGFFEPAMVQDIRPEDFRKLLEVNVFGTVAATLPALEHMRDQGSGAIVNVTSGSQAGDVGLSAYGATKGAIASLTYAWAAELAGSGVRVNAVSPLGETAMAAEFRPFIAGHRDDREVTLPPSLPDPALAAPLVGFLLSDDAGAVNGQTVRIAGGELSLITHPAILEPTLQREVWTFEDIREAFRDTLNARQMPSGLSRVEQVPK